MIATQTAITNATMKALEKTKPERGLWMVENAPIPDIGPNNVLIRITKSAICGTDLHIYKWDDWASKTIPTPMIVGHEYVGVIEQMGSEVRDLKIGQRVSGEGHLTCGTCRNCRAGTRHLCRNTLGIGVNVQGSFAQYLSLPVSNIFPIPDDITDDTAAIFDPLGNAVHTALSFDLVGEDVLITGAGPIGIMAIAVCKHAGAKNVVITDINPYRLKLAAKMGATRCVDSTKENLNIVMTELGMTEGFDIGLEMSGNESAFRSMLETMNHGGKISLLGIPPGEMSIDWNDVIFKGLIIKGIYGREMYETWYKMTSMLQSGLDISSVITHRMHIDDFQKGFDAMESGACGKVILDWE
jgi:threonine 3-dehydrogenase